MNTFIWHGSKPQAMKGTNDDLIISAAIGVWVLEGDAAEDVNAAEAAWAMVRASSVRTNENDAIKDTHSVQPAGYFGSPAALDKKPIDQDQAEKMHPGYQFNHNWLY